MFIKIEYWTVKKDDNMRVIERLDHTTMGYDCNNYSLGNFSSKENRDDLSLVIDQGTINERVITLFTNDLKMETDLFIMNNEGKTIDHYVF